MPKSPITSCEVVVADDKKVYYSLRMDKGFTIQKRFDDYDKLYLKIAHLLPASHSGPPKKRLLMPESKLLEKRRSWILSVAQTLLQNQNNLNDDIRDFFCLPVESEEALEVLPKEVKTAVPGDFEVLKTIGKGSFGRVFQVKHKKSNTIYAMKVLSKEQIRKKNETKHVMAELSVLKMNINHPFLVSLHFSFQTKDKLYFILDHLNGGELFSHLQKEKHFNEGRCRFYAADMAAALGYLHENNIIYRDLKPENLLLDREGYIILTDFGLCKEGMKAGTTTGTFCGTPEYLAPEIVMKKPYERSVDWWCLGAVLYEMFYGLPPFYSRDHQEMYDKIVNHPLRFKHPVSAAATDIITGLLSKDPKKRLGCKQDFTEIKNHPFFMPINFDQLLAKTIRAPYVPNVKDEMDLKHISQTFTKEPFNPQSLVPENLATTRREHDFIGFTYTGEPNIK